MELQEGNGVFKFNLASLLVSSSVVRLGGGEVSSEALLLQPEHTDFKR